MRRNRSSLAFNVPFLIQQQSRAKNNLNDWSQICTSAVKTLVPCEAIPVTTKMQWIIAISALMLVAVSAIPAVATCAAPSSEGIKICFPSEGSTVTYPAALEMSANTGSAYVVKSAVYDNGRLVDTNNFLPGTLVDGGIKNGAHKLTVKAWDSNGSVHQATRSFHVTGYGVAVCGTPSKAGVNLCWPNEGSLQPNTSIPISAKARGNNSKIKWLSVYLDGKFYLGTGNDFILTSAGLSAGQHRVAVVARDFAGHTYKTAHYFNAFYNYDCNPRSGACTPGIVLNNLTGNDVPNSFRLDAEVVNNPKPTTSMKLYLDGSVVATSTGPGITKQLSLQPNTTHIISVKAWDTAGKVYATYQTIYVQ